MSDSDRDRPLIDALVADEKLENPHRRFACTGRFLTMHKRRRKKLTTRALIQDTAILDDIHHGQVQCILNQVGNWKFNAFTLETVTGGEWSNSLTIFIRCIMMICLFMTNSVFHFRSLTASFMCSFVSLVWPFGPLQIRRS